MTADPTTLLGSWDFERSIDDRTTGVASRVSGTAVFELSGTRIRWAESGTWFRGAAAVPVQRTLWIEERPGGWFVTFEDGRDFHPWVVEVGVSHPCGRDTYVGLVIPGTDASRWGVEWVVTGPAKDYTMRTAYARG